MTLLRICLVVLLIWSQDSTSVGLRLKSKQLSALACTACLLALSQNVARAEEVFLPNAQSYVTTKVDAGTQEGTPSDADNNLVRMGFRDYNDKRFDAAEEEFTLALKRWEELRRPRDEVVSILKARANVRLDAKRFPDSLKDLDVAIGLMSDGEKEDGTGRYPEYADSWVNHALAWEGMGEWEKALGDYDHAVRLWGGGRSENVNPFVLTYRGNVLSRLGKYEQAIVDYSASADTFLRLRDLDRFSDAKTNEALALYALDRREEAIRGFKRVLIKNPGFVDARVALATDSWDRGEFIPAMNQWEFVCNEVSVGCEAYKDLQWVSTVRRWPSNLVAKLDTFLSKKIPSGLEENSLAKTKMSKPLPIPK